mmetsp:Transcript_12351/g.27044  ORF Transcript_12351/g.27044 Transcript_12351/m.27044 type:complete len:362 (-) Transcript_12351:233-1318(-)
MGTIIVSIFLLSTLLAPASGISPGPIANTNRRCLLKSIASAVPLSIQSVAFPRSANAAGPLATYETDSIAAVLQRKYLLPKPTRLLRPKLNMEFAVLLMRSSYSVLDDLDCVPMDQFQRDFFLIRQAEYQPYVDALGGVGSVSQGDLTDPNYFDFISFAQYAAISRDVNAEPLPIVFTEQQPAPVTEDDEIGSPQGRFVDVVVRRPPELLDNKLLPVEHRKRVGDQILKRLEEIFRDTPAKLPEMISRSSTLPRLPPNELLPAVNQLVKLFLINGFALDGSVEMTLLPRGSGNSNGIQLSITLVSPSILWSGKALQSRKTNPTNDFMLKTVESMVTKLGYNVLSSSVKYTKTEELSILTIV